MGRGRETERGSVAPRSHAFRSVMAAAQAAQTLFVRPRRVHMHTPRRRAVGPGRPAGRPASLPSLKEEKKSDRGRQRGNNARSPLSARGVYWVFGDTESYPRNTGASRSFAQRTSFPARVSDAARSCDTSDTEHVGHFSVACHPDIILIVIINIFFYHRPLNSLKKFVMDFFRLRQLNIIRLNISSRNNRPIFENNSLIIRRYNGAKYHKSGRMIIRIRRAINYSRARERR